MGTMDSLSIAGQASIKLQEFYIFILCKYKCHKHLRKWSAPKLIDLRTEDGVVVGLCTFISGQPPDKAMEEARMWPTGPGALL